jgi:hypothetical protein
MFGRDKGFGVPAVAVAMAGPEGKEKRVELFVGERRSGEGEERTEKREGGSADMKACVNPTRIGELSDIASRRRRATRYLQRRLVGDVIPHELPC